MDTGLKHSNVEGTWYRRKERDITFKAPQYRIHSYDKFFFLLKGQ